MRPLADDGQSNTILPPNGTGLTFIGNTYNGICIESGSITSSQVWNSVSYDYVLLGNISEDDRQTIARRILAIRCS